MHGFLLPTSLFVLSFDNPLFKGQNTLPHGLSAFLKPESYQNPLQILSTAIEFSVPTSLTLPSVEPQPCFLNRRIFFDLEGPHLQLVRAVSSVLSRLGGQIAADIRACDWIVTQTRSGSSYLHVSRLESIPREIVRDGS